MTVDEAIEKYIEKFGGFPAYLFMSAADEYIISEIEKALESGKEIEADEDDEDILY